MRAFVPVAFLCLGCATAGEPKPTQYNYVNMTDHLLRVEIAGVTPNASPGMVNPHTGSSRLRRVEKEYQREILVADAIEITWTKNRGDQKNHALLRREGLGLPARLSGGKLEFTYTAQETWEVKYYQNWKPPPPTGY